MGEWHSSGCDASRGLADIDTIERYCAVGRGWHAGFLEDRNLKMWVVAMRTFLVGQSRLFRAAFSRLLQGTTFAVSAAAESLQDAAVVDGVRSGDQVVLLLQKPDRLADLETEIEGLKACGVPPWIVILARSLDASEIAEGFLYGVDGYLLEEISPEALVESLNLVILGEKVFPSQLVDLLTEADWAKSRSRASGEYDANLSEREFEIVNWLARGAPNKVIAGKMSITEATVKVHIKAILKKVGVHNRTQAAIWAVQRGLLAGAGE